MQILPRTTPGPPRLELRPDRYTHYYKNEFPERFHPLMDTRRWGPGEHLVSSPTPGKSVPKLCMGSPATESLPKGIWLPQLWRPSAAAERTHLAEIRPELCKTAAPERVRERMPASLFTTSRIAAADSGFHLRTLVPKPPDAYIFAFVLTGVGSQLTLRLSISRRAGLLFADIEAFRLALLEMEPKDFVSHHIFEPVPFAFNSDLSSWIRWKTNLARLLEVDPQDIVLIGTAAVGYSLNPHKNCKAFDNTSDIDCGVISQHHFEIAWRYLRQIRPSWLTLPSLSKRAIEMHRKNYVFSGTIASDSILALLPFGREWQRALDEMSKSPPTVGRAVKLRIYKDYDALRHYQALGIEKLRNEIVETISLESEIPVED